MYYPYLRGKQYELVLLKEQASFLSKNKIHPIIEPVKKDLGPLRKTLVELVRKEVHFTLVFNPQCGELKENSRPILDLWEELKLRESPGLMLGYIVNAVTDKTTVKSEIGDRKEDAIAMIHYGFSDGQWLSTTLKKLANVKANIFIDNYAGSVYQKSFDGSKVPTILIRDGFKVRRNDQYPQSEHFSDLHLTYLDEGFSGFGDYLIVGEAYREGGGAAHAVAIHMSYLSDDDDMHMMHFVSDRRGSAADPAGKFREALKKLNDAAIAEDSPLLDSNACDKYLELHETEHYPGLGYVKKLSMQHHIELISHYLYS